MLPRAARPWGFPSKVSVSRSPALRIIRSTKAGGPDRAGATKSRNGFIAVPTLPSCAAQPSSKYTRDARERASPERDDHERFIKVRIQPTSIPLGRIPKFSPVSGSIRPSSLTLRGVVFSIVLVAGCGGDSSSPSAHSTPTSGPSAHATPTSGAASHRPLQIPR